MTPPFVIDIERPAALTAEQERGLLRSAVAKAPGLIDYRAALASSLILNDDFDEAIALIEAADRESRNANCYNLLAEAHLARETETDSHLACEAARRAADLSEAPVLRADALANLGKAQKRVGLRDAAIETLTEALAVNPHDRNAYKRLATLHLEAGETGAAHTLASRLLAQGVAHSRLFASQALALALDGDVAAARETVGLPQMLFRRTLPPPDDWDSLDDFHHALTQELLGHPSLRFDRYGTASAKTWRIDEPAAGNPPLIAVLQRHLLRQVQSYARDVAQHDHPWVKHAPPAGIFHNWCVITDGDGYETWHVHQHGWLSGVYYIAVPDEVRGGTGLGGCLSFGLPEDVIGVDAAAAFGQHIERPEPGVLMMFPSHTYHRTFPHGATGRRICLAFDIWPA